MIDPQGRRVRRLGGEELSAGTHVLRWEGQDESGAVLPTGIYFMRVQAGTGSSVVKLVQMR